MTRAALSALLLLSACHRSGTPLARAPRAPERAATTAAATVTPRTGPDVSAYYRLADTVEPYPYRWMRIEPPLNIAVDAAGNPHLSARQYNLGYGLIGITDDATGTTEIVVDSSYITHRVFDEPVEGTACTVGTGAWYATKAALLFCVPNDAHDGFVWARIPATPNAAPPPVAGCLVDPQGNMLCPSPVLTPFPPTPLEQVTAEVATPVRSGVWQLGHVPFQVIECLRNGATQLIGSDFVSSGTWLTSGVWAAGDAISCTYTYAKF